MFIIQVLIGTGVMFLWSPAAALLGITQPWVSIIFIVVWLVFWMCPVGKDLEDYLRRQINGG